MTQDELKLVLDALKWCHGGEPCGTAEAIAVVEKALAQPEQFCDANCVWTDHHPDCKLAQPQQEPVAWMYQEYRDDDQFGWRDEILFTPPPNDPIYFRNITPLYTQSASDYERGFIDGMQKQMQSSVDKAVNAMSQRPWVGLTDEEHNAIYNQCQGVRVGSAISLTEAKLKEKNT